MALLELNAMEDDVGASGEITGRVCDIGADWMMSDHVMSWLQDKIGDLWCQ